MIQKRAITKLDGEEVTDPTVKYLLDKIIMNREYWVKYRGEDKLGNDCYSIIFASGATLDITYEKTGY